MNVRVHSLISATLAFLIFPVFYTHLYISLCRIFFAPLFFIFSLTILQYPSGNSAILRLKFNCFVVILFSLYVLFPADLIHSFFCAVYSFVWGSGLPGNGTGIIWVLNFTGKQCCMEMQYPVNNAFVLFALILDLAMVFDNWFNVWDWSGDQLISFFKRFLSRFETKTTIEISFCGQEINARLIGFYFHLANYAGSNRFGRQSFIKLGNFINHQLSLQDICLTSYQVGEINITFCNSLSQRNMSYVTSFFVSEIRSYRGWRDSKNIKKGHRGDIKNI